MTQTSNEQPQTTTQGRLLSPFSRWTIRLSIATVVIFLGTLAFDNHLNTIATTQSEQLQESFQREERMAMTQYSEALARNNTPCVLLRRERYQALGLAHALCIREELARERLGQAKMRLNKAITSLTPVQVVVFYPVMRHDKGLSNPAITSQVSCIKSVYEEAKRLSDFPFANYLPGLANYRVYVSPGLSYKDSCNGAA